MLECKECGVEVRKRATPIQSWGKGEPGGEYYHIAGSKDGVSRCAKQFLTEDEVTDPDDPAESEVLVQD